MVVKQKIASLYPKNTNKTQINRTMGIDRSPEHQFS